MKKSALIKKARNLIKSRKERYVCRSIYSVGDKVGDRTTSDTLYRWIHNDLIPGYTDYNHWLRDNHPALAKEPYGSYTEARLEWMSWMIKYWKERGD